MHLMMAGSREANAAMLDYARRAVRRAYGLGYTILVGDNPKGVDLVVVRECRRLKAKVIVFGVANFPRNGGCGQYVKVETDLYLSMKGMRLNRYTVRDRYIVDQSQIALFIWNGDSPGTKSGYDYAVSRGKTAHLIQF